jgi:hypothetical protein
MIKFRDYSGQRFGKLVAIKYIERRNKLTIWLCQCDCGNTKEISLYSFKYGNTKTCGCSKEYSGANNPNYKNGLCYSKEYSIWSAMKRRCKNPKHKDYKHYGERGIKVCERWLSFDNFYEDMGKIPSEKHSIDRIDVNAGYCKENCKWATQREQMSNRRVKSNTGIVGVSLCKRGKKYMAYITTNRVMKNLGWFSTLEEAIEARKNAEIKYWGNNDKS